MSTITQLEQTLIDIATNCLSNVLEAVGENHSALMTLVQLAHLTHSGLSEDARTALLDIEEGETALLRKLVN